MTRQPKAIAGANDIARGLWRMGITGRVLVILQAEDGERLEELHGEVGEFADIPLKGGQLVRTVTLGDIAFRWPKRSKR